jgi:1D-myo-inositol 3-kinase
LSAIPDYVVIGHVTHDLVPQGGFRAGGTATYSALAAERLGLSVGVLTSARVAPVFDSACVQVHCRAAEDTTTFENVYTAGARRQYIRAVAGLLTLADVPADWGQAPIIHLGPVAQEVAPALVESFPHSLVGLTPQGWLRRWDAQGLVSPTELTDAASLLGAAGVVVLSLEDLGGDRQRLERYRSWARLLVLTVGREGAIVFSKGQQQRVPAYVVAEVDPTGAGDIFAAAYFVRLHETGDVIEAARFANSAASFVVEGVGTASVPSREQVEWRLRNGLLHS